MILGAIKHSGIARLFRTGLLRRTAGQIAVTFGGQASVSVSKFVTLLLISRFLGAERFAVCAVYLSSSLVLVNLCELGLNVTTLKFLAVTDADRWRRYAARLISIRLVAAGAMLAGVYLLSEPVSRLALHHAEYAGALRLAAIAAAFSSASGYFLNLLQSRQQFHRMASINVASAVLQAAPILLTRALGWDPVWALLAGEILSRSAMLAACFGVMRDVWIGFWLPGDRPGIWEVARFARWIGLSVLIGSVQGYIPTVALARWNQPSALAIYAMGSSLASGFSLLMTTTCLVLLPQALLSKTATDRLKYAATYLKSGAIVCGAMIAVTWLAAPLAAPLFAHDMRDAAGVFRILAAAAIVLLALNPVQFLLYSMDQPALCTAADALIAIAFAALAALLAPSFGAYGTSWALFLSQSSIKAITAWGILRHLKRAAAQEGPAALEPEFSTLR